jgi:hypothetical protein
MLDKQQPDILAKPGESTGVERRTGRRRYLVPRWPRLLRRNGGSLSHPLNDDDLDDRDPDQLKPFTGIIVAVGLSVPIWLTITGLLYLLI